jgi:hypothetical protein
MSEELGGTNPDPAGVPAPPPAPAAPPVPPAPVAPPVPQAPAAPPVPPSPMTYSPPPPPPGPQSPYGAAYPPAGGYAPGYQKSGLATASMVVGIVGLVLTIVPFVTWIGLICDIVAIALGAVAQNRARTEPVANVGAAKAGLIMGCIGLGLFLLVLVVIGSLFASILGGLSSLPH